MPTGYDNWIFTMMTAYNLLLVFLKLSRHMKWTKLIIPQSHKIKAMNENTHVYKRTSWKSYEEGNLKWNVQDNTESQTQFWSTFGWRDSTIESDAN